MQHTVTDLRKTESSVPATPSIETVPTPPAAHANHATRRLAVIGGGVLAVIVIIGAFTLTLHGYLTASSREREAGTPLSWLSERIAHVFGSARDTVAGPLRIARAAQAAAQVVPHALRGEQGELLITHLNELREALYTTTQQTAEVRTAIPALSLINLFGSRIDAQATDLVRLLDAAIPWLSTTEAHHVAVLLGNTAEMRPGGGFVGSYADVAIAGGAVRSITVHDVNEVDRARSAQVIPPQQLQPIARRWRVADANWFANFPDSARTIQTFMNESTLHNEPATHIDAVIAISPRLIANILEQTGSITLADGTELTADNFLRAIQADVQAGQASRDADPKSIIGDAVVPLLDRLSEQGGGVGLLNVLYNAAQQKDLVLWFAQPELQAFAERYGVAGRLYDLPAHFSGEYVSVATANIGGDKTDAVTDQAVGIQSRILPSGLVETRVRITRTHHGDKEQAWWYREAYRGYVKVYTPSDAEPLTAQGLWQRERTPRTYGSEFSTHPLVLRSEQTLRTVPALPGLQTFTEASRNVFGFWQRVQPGTSSTAEVAYARALPTPVQSGMRFQFILDRQPASTASYAIELIAPPGYVWQENGLSALSFESTDIPGRLELALTLVQDGQ